LMEGKGGVRITERGGKGRGVKEKRNKGRVKRKDCERQLEKIFPEKLIRKGWGR